MMVRWSIAVAVLVVALLVAIGASWTWSSTSNTTSATSTAPTAPAPPSAPPPDYAPPTAASSPSSVSDKRSPALARPTLGSSVVRVPATMKEGREAIARLIVSPTDLASLLAQTAGLTGDGDVRAAADRVRLQPRMRATLSAPGFDLAPKEAQEQVVKVDEPTVWLWTLVPTERGQRTLVFTLEGLVVVDGRETALRPPALLVPVEVDVDPMLWLGKYWQWLTTVFIVPLAIFFGRRWLDRRSARPRRS